MINNNEAVRILAIAPTSRGFGYAVMEGADQLRAIGNKTILHNKNTRALVWVDKFIRLYKPSILVLPDVNAKGEHRAGRIKTLHKSIGELARKHQLKVKLISGSKLREQLTGSHKGTKQAMAEALSGKYSDQLQSRLPAKRRAWESEDPRMDIFDAVGLAVVFWPQAK